MALPHMPSVYTTRKNVYEAAIVRRRMHEDDHRARWSSASNYFSARDIDATKKNAWTSAESYHSSMDAYKSAHERETKSLTLQRRQRRLAELLQKEKDGYEAELRGYSSDNYSRIDDMKERVDSLKSAREEKRKMIADEKLYEHFRKNNPDIRQLERRQHKDHVIGGWSDQVDEKQQRIESARREKEEYERRLEEERLAALEEEKIKEQLKIHDEKQMKRNLLDQMEELKHRESEADMLKSQQDELQKEQWRIESLEEERRQMEEAHRKQELGRVLLRQHKQKLRQQTQRIQKELELDRQILESLLGAERENQALQTARKEKAKADASWMKQVIEDQIKLEKAREAELDMLYQDEAARVWQKREAEWAKERQAREKLMKEVLEGRQDQLEDKMESVRRQQEESLERREELLREMEVAQQLTRREAAETERQKEERKQDLQTQMTSRREQHEKGKLADELEKVAEKRAEGDYEELLRQEAARLNIRGYQPGDHGRRQAWM